MEYGLQIGLPTFRMRYFLFHIPSVNYIAGIKLLLIQYGKDKSHSCLSLFTDIFYTQYEVWINVWGPQTVFYHTSPSTVSHFLAINFHYLLRLSFYQRLVLKIPALWDVQSCRCIKSSRRFPWFAVPPSSGSNSPWRGYKFLFQLHVLSRRYYTADMWQWKIPQ